jgi:hypothetical protein
MTLVIQNIHCFNFIYKQPFKSKIMCHKKNLSKLLLNFLRYKCKLTFTFVDLTQKSIELGCFETCTIKVHNQYFILVI